LQDHLVHQPGVEVFMETTATSLLTGRGRVVGALAYRRADARLILFTARAVVLATGGWGKIYRVTSNSWESTGDGTALAYSAGARLQDCEMVQFHPTGMVWPPGVKGLLVTESVRGEGGLLTNSEGDRFMSTYDPKRMELSTRDVVARAINQEVNEGRGSPHGGAFLSVTHLDGAYVKRRLPSMWEQFHKLADIDITKEPMEVAPTIHYAMGGVRVEAETGATNLDGLYAAGEVACGLHGANRLGGNSLTDLLVFGKRAGEAAALFAQEAGPPPPIKDSDVAEHVREMEAPLHREGESPYLLHAELQDVVTQHAPIIRDEAGLKAGLKKILALKERAAACGTGGPNGTAFNPGWHTALDVQGMIVNAEAVMRCAIERRESRGAHTRSDYPDYDPELEKVNFVVERARDGSMAVKRMEKPPIPAEMMEIVHSEFSLDYVRED
ncbi:MAG: FAD-binding protein, partial [Candidatus Dormibacterales bacterium]